jgi:hypothetical protein
MVRQGILVEKQAGLTTVFEGKDHSYVHCVISDPQNPERRFECRVLDEEDIPISIGEPIQLEVLKVITDRRSGVVRFDCHLIKTSA